MRGVQYVCELWVSKLSHHDCYPSVTQLADGLFLATWNGCNCSLTFEPRSKKKDETDVEMVVVGGRTCENFPNCFFPIEVARIEAEIILDANAIEPKYEMCVPDVSVVENCFD